LKVGMAIMVLLNILNETKSGMKKEIANIINQIASVEDAKQI